jgi:hypothetical protein
MAEYLGQIKTALLKEKHEYKELFPPFPESEYADFRKRIHESLIVEKPGKGSRSFQDSTVKAIAEALGTEEAPRSFSETPGEVAEARIDTPRLNHAGAKALVLEPCLRRGRLLAGHLRAILNGGRSIEIRHETLHCLVWLLQSIF